MLRAAAPVCAAAVALATGVGAQSRGQTLTSGQQRAVSFRLVRGRILVPSAHGISVVVEASRGSFRTLRAGTTPRAVLADAAADLDGDGLPDLVTHYNSEEGDPGCSESSGVTVCTSWAYVSRALDRGRFRRPRVVYRSDVDTISPLAAGDVTGDGRPDLVLPFDNGVYVFVNHGAGRLRRRRRVVSTGQPPVAVALVDLNGDGRLDLVSANSEDETNRLADGTVAVFFGVKVGFGRRHAYRIGGGADGLVVQDLNGDGRPDVAVSRGEAGRFVSVLLNRGNGSLRAKRDYRVAGRYAYAVTAADVNGDGTTDLVASNGGHGVSVFLNRGNGTFAPAVTVARHTLAVALSAGDLNGDGRADILVQTGYGPRALVALVNTR